MSDERTRDDFVAGYGNACESQGLPRDCSVERFVQHHRGNAAFAAALESADTIDRLTAERDALQDENERLVEAVKRHAWSVALADHVGDACEAMDRMLDAAGLDPALYDDDGSVLLNWPIDPRYPDDEVERYAALATVERGGGEG